MLRQSYHLRLGGRETSRLVARVLLFWHTTRKLIDLRLDFRTVNRFCAELNLNTEKPVIDLRHINFVETFGLVYLCMFIRHHNRYGKFFDIHPPSESKVDNYLTDQRFWEWIGPQSNRQETRLVSPFPNAFNRMINLESDPFVADEIGDWLLKHLSDDPSFIVDVYLVSEMATELVDNFQQHAEVPVAVCCFQKYPTLKRLVFAIGDLGIGIRKSLSINSSFQYLMDQDHESAALRAFDDNVTRRQEGGTGLGTVRRDVLELGGQMFLATGNAWVRLGAKLDGFDSGLLDMELPGVQIEVSIPAEVVI